MDALTFFSLTTTANLFETVMSINRFIDMHRDSLHLDTFFNFVQNNLDLFSTEAFKRRLSEKGYDKEYCEDFGRIHKPITKETIVRDKAKIESLPIRNLKGWRDKKLAHIEKRFVAKDIDVLKKYPLTVTEIDDVLRTLHEILDRYRLAFDGVGWVLGLPPTKPQIEHIMDSLEVNRRLQHGR
jgi:hypothetical protein